MSDQFPGPGYEHVPQEIARETIPYANPAEVRAALTNRVELVMQPGITRQWEEFRETAEPHSIAIDGYVEGPIQRDLQKKVVNLNHHERVDRSSTFATCQQALFELRKGMNKFMQINGEFNVKVFMNDCDEDVCTTVFLLKHPDFASQIDNPALNRLVEMEGVMDITGGFYPWPQNYPSLPEFFWVYEPYHNFRNSGGLTRPNPEEYLAVIEEVGQRIEQHITGNGSATELDPRYEVIDQAGLVSMVRETGKHAKVGMLSDGIEAFVSISELPNGRYKYSVGRLSQYTPFDITGLYAYLNELEGLEGDDRWGGGDTIGGSPRLSGSGIAPDQMAIIVQRFITPPEAEAN